MTDSAFPSISLLSHASLAGAGRAAGQAAGAWSGSAATSGSRAGALRGVRPGRPRDPAGRGGAAGARSGSPAARRRRSIPATGVSDADTLGGAAGRLGPPGVRRLCRGRPRAGGSRSGDAGGRRREAAPSPLRREPDAEALESGAQAVRRGASSSRAWWRWTACRRPTGAEVCFAGRSNVGKSTLINALTGRKALARASNTPGRTQEINFFALGADRYLVDLPGLRLRRGAEAGGRALAGAAASLPGRPRRPCAGRSC